MNIEIIAPNMPAARTLRSAVVQILAVFTIVAITVFILYISLPKQTQPVKVEAVQPKAIHPISKEFNTGYVLVEVWTTTTVRGIEVDVPHIIRMRRSEYLEWMNQ